MIDKIKQTLGQIFFSPEASGTWDSKDIECAIDEDVVECDEMDSPYVGVPAPVLNPVDDWFTGPYGCPTAITEKQKDYMVQETEIKKQEENQAIESENIHQEMYDIATKNGKTTVQLNPVGGSETFQEGPGGWTSGTGYQGQGLTDR